MFLNQLEFQRYIQASAKRANLNVRWQDSAIPHTNRDTIVLPILPATATIEDYRKQLHYANHEVDHILYTDFEQHKKYNCDAMRSFLGFLWNGVEDVRIEWLGGKEYEGDRANTDDVYPSLFEHGFKKLAETANTMTAERKELLDRVLPLLWWMNEAHSDNYSSTAAVKPQIEKHLSKEAAATVEKFKAGDYLSVLRNIRDIEDPEAGTDATFQLAKRIYEEVYDLNAQQELDRLQEPPPSQDGKDGSQEGKGSKPKPVTVAKAKPASAPKEKKDEEGEASKSKPEDEDDKDGADGQGTADDSSSDEGDQKEEGAGDTDGNGEQSDSPSDEGSDHNGDANEGDASSDGGSLGQKGVGESKGRDKLVSVKYQEFLPTAHDQAAPKDRASISGEGLHIDYDDYLGSCQYNPATKDQYLVADFCRNQYSDTELIESNPVGMAALTLAYRTAMEKATGIAFAARVRTRLQIRAKDKFEHGVKRGKLQTSLLHRVTMQDARELNQRVFKRKIVNDTLDTAVIWLGDGSDSMAGRKYAHLMGASVQFNEAVGNVIGLPIEIHSFTDNYRHIDGDDVSFPVMYVHRDFNTRRLGEDELVRRMAVAGHHLHANPDGDAILWSYDRLIRSRAKRKILIVASDGQPATCIPGDCPWYTKQVVREIEQNTPIEIIGVGIMDDNVSRIYKEHYVINDAAELEKALLTLIDKKIH